MTTVLNWSWQGGRPPQSSYRHRARPSHSLWLRAQAAPGLKGNCTFRAVFGESLDERSLLSELPLEMHLVQLELVVFVLDLRRGADQTACEAEQASQASGV